MLKTLQIALDPATAVLFFQDGINLLNGADGFPPDQRGKPIIIGDHPIRDVIWEGIIKLIGQPEFDTAHARGGIHNTFLYVPKPGDGGSAHIFVGIGSLDSLRWNITVQLNSAGGPKLVSIIR